MSKRITALLQGLGFIFGAAAALVIAAALFIGVGYEADKTQTELTAQIQDRYQRNVSIEGGLRLALWPWPTMHVDRLSLSEVKRPAPFLSITDARLRLAIWPLLTGRFVVTRLEAENVQAALVRERNGTWNVSDLFGMDDKQALFDLFEVDALRIKNMQLRVTDEASGESIELREVVLATGPLHASAVGNVNAHGKFSAKAFTADGSFELLSKYSIAATADSGRLQQANLRLDGRAFSLTESRSALKLNELVVSSVESLELSGASFTMRGNRGADVIEASANLPALKWSQDRPAAASLEARMSLSSKTVQWEVSAALSNLGPATGGFAAARAQIQAQAKRGENISTAHLTSPLRVDWSDDSVSLERLSGDVAIAHPRFNAERAKAGIDGNVILRWGQPQLGKASQIKLTARMANDEYKVSANVARFRPLAANLEVSGDKLDLDALLSAPADNAAPFVVPEDWLTGLAVYAQIKFGDLKFRGIQLKAVEAVASAGNGKFAISPHRAQLYGGTWEGELVLDSAARLTLNQRLRGVHLDELIYDSGVQLPATGVTNASLEMTAEGRQLSAWKDSAQGELRVYAKEAALLGVDMSQALARFSAVKGSSETASLTAQDTARTELNELSGKFRVKGQQLVDGDIAASNRWLRIKGEGSLDMAQQTLDMILRATVTGLPSKSAAKGLGELRGRTLPLKLHGAFAQPSVDLQERARSATPSPVSPRATQNTQSVPETNKP